MNCEYKLTLDKEYVFNTEQELNDVLQGVDMEAVVANPSKYKVENGRVVENQIKKDNQLTEQQRQNIQELKQLEPAYAVASDKVVQSFIESIYPESKVKDVVWHGSNVTIDNFEIRKEPLIHFGTINAAKQRSSEFENFVLHPSILNIKDLRKVEDGMWFGQKVLMYLYENKLISEQETAEISNKSYQEGNNYQGENPSQRNQVIQKAFNKNITEFLNTNNLGNLGFVYENFSEDKGSNSYAVFEPEQITILNSPETIQKFKEFIGKEQPVKYQKTFAENEVAYTLKSVDILQSDKAKQVFNILNKNKVTGDNFWNKVQKDLQIPANQIELLKQYNTTNREELITNMLADYSFVVESNDIKSQNYNQLTVPGGTNYTENEISTPLITPSIKGHAQFSTNNGIGWFRSDEQNKNKALWFVEEPFSFFSKRVNLNNYRNRPNYSKDRIRHQFNSKKEADEFNLKNYNNQWDVSYTDKPDEGSKTRRILELQSDLFQKGRDKDTLTKDDNKNTVLDDFNVGDSYDFQIIKNNSGKYEIESKRKLTNEELKDEDYKENWEKGYIIVTGFGEFETENVGSVTRERFLKTLKEENKNQFLQLLNKDNNWVTFFVKSIIQDSAKKGYEKVLFPSGNTSVKIESPNTGIQNIEDAKDRGENNLANTGLFYENTVTNILNKQFGKENVKQITDEYGNTWNEIDLSNQKVKEQTNLIKLQRITTGTKSIQNYKQVLDKLAKKFNIRYQLVNDSSVNWKGKFQNGVVYINEANFTDDTLFHEFIHPFIEAVKTKNPKLYQQLSNEIQTDERGFNTLEKVKQLYPELNEEEQIEEAIVQLMGEYSAEIANTAATEKSLFGYLRKLWNWISNELKSYLRKTVSVEELSPTMTLEELSYLIALGNKPINLWSEQRVRAEKITNNLLNKGFVITGSLALSKQGTVIRPSDEVHDLDFYVQLETDDDLQKNLIEKDDFRQELITMNALRKFTVNDLAEQDWFKNLLLEYPELKSYRIITSKEAYEEGINPETAKVIVLTNLTTVSQGVATRTIRTNIDNIPVDFFVTYQPISNVQGYRNADAILEIKQEWAREKDLQDVANYKEHKPKYQKTNTKQQEVLNTLNKLKVDKKDAEYKSGNKVISGVTTFIDLILEKAKNEDLGYKFNLDEFLFKYKQDLNAKYKVTEITNVKEQNDVYAKIEEEVNVKKNDMKSKTDAGSKLHLVFESVFNGVEPTNESDFTSKEVFDTVVNQAKAVKVKLINESKAKFGTEPVFVTEKPIIAKMLDGNQLAGTIDLMVIHENGTVDILDWKTSTKDAGEWDDNKKKHIYFQTQFYKRMLESLGLTVNEPKIVPVTKFDVVNDKITNVTIMEARTAKQEVDNSVQINNVVSQYFEPKTISRESQPVTNQINNFLEKAFNYKKEVVDTEVTDEDIAKFKKKNNFEGQYEEQLINSSKKISYYDSIKSKRVEYESDAQIKEYLQELKQYNANVRDRMISFYNDLKEGKEPKYKVNNFAKDDKTAELTAVFNRYVDWDLIEDDVVMKELDVIGFKNPRTNQVAFITVNPEQEGQLDLNFSKGNKLEFRENTVLSNYRKSVQDIRMMKATTSNLHLIKLGLFVATANKIDGDIEHIIVLSEKNSPQIQDMNTIQHNIKEILKQDDFGFKVESKEYKVNKLDTLQDFYNSMIKLNTNKKKYDDIMKQLNKEDAKIVLAKRQAEMMREYSQESLKENQEFILLNDALLYLNNIQLEIEEDISAWGYFVYSGNRSSAETDTPNNIVNKIVQQVKKLIDYAITQFRYEYEEWYPTFAKVTKKLIDSKQSLIRQNVVGDTDKVFENIIDKETMTIKPLNQLNKEEREFAEYFMNEIDKVRQRTMGSNYAKLTEEQKREIPLIKAYTEQSKGTWEQRIKSEWEDMLNTDNLLSVDFQENRKQRVEIANRFAYQESHRQDVLLSGEKFETNLAYVLNTYLLHDIKRRKFNEVMPTINALKFMAFTSDVNMFKNLQNVYSVVDSLIDNVVFNTNKLSPEGQKSMKIVKMLSGQVQNLAIGLSPMTGLVQGLIGIMNNVSFAVSNKLVSTESYGKALGKAVTKNIKDIEKRDKLNNLYGLVSKDIDLVAKQNSFINTGLRAFGSRWLHWFNYIPDFFNRTVMFTAKMIEDGNYDAHTVVDDVLVYDETKDKRFFTNGKFDEKHPDLLFLKSKLKEEGGLDSIGKAKRAYTFEEIRSIKEYVNQVHGYMSKEDKIKFSHTVFGVMYMQFKSWLRSKLDQYWKTYRVNEVIGHWQQIYEYDGDSIKLDENGNPVLKRDENGVPIKIWTGTPEEGFINTLLYMMFEAKQWNPNKLEGWRQQNLKQGFTDIALVALMAALSAALDDDDQERDRIEYLMYKLSKDAFIFNAVSSNFFTAQMPVASISYSADMLRNIWNISDKGLEPIIYQIGLTRSAYNLIAD